jgi:hypothetical protein
MPSSDLTGVTCDECSAPIPCDCVRIFRSVLRMESATQEKNAQKETLTVSGAMTIEMLVIKDRALLKKHPGTL